VQWITHRPERRTAICPSRAGQMSRRPGPARVADSHRPGRARAAGQPQGL